MRATVIMLHIILIQLLYLSEINCKKRILNQFSRDIEQNYFPSILDKISRIKDNVLFDKRRYGDVDTSKTRYLLEALSDTIKPGQFNNWLRNEALEGVEKGEKRSRLHEEEDLELLVENELLNALSKKSSAMLDKPYVQKKGRNDFLVIRTGLKDPFVTIVPNDIYYNSEKKCINWLDDCNHKGLRERLLQKVNSPYK